MLFFETKFFYYLGNKQFSKVNELLNIYMQKKGKTSRYFEYCFNYYFEIKDLKKAFDSFVNCVNLKKVNLKFENWVIDIYIDKNVSNSQYQVAAQNAMKLAHLENLSTQNRIKLLNILDYIKTKL